MAALNADVVGLWGSAVLEEGCKRMTCKQGRLRHREKQEQGGSIALDMQRYCNWRS